MKPKIFYISIDDTEGMDAIALVDYPAVEVDFLKFAKEQPKHIAFDSEQHIITGVVCLADTPIYRYNDQMGEYYVVFTKETIKKMVAKYSRNKLWNSINLQHNDALAVDCVIMLESYMISKERGICPKEFAEVPDGSWLCSFHVEDDSLWEQIKTSGELNGFSIQGWFDLEVEKDMEEMSDKRCLEDTDEMTADDLIEMMAEFASKPADNARKVAEIIAKYENVPESRMNKRERLRYAIAAHKLVNIQYTDEDGYHTYRDMYPYVLGYTKAAHEAIRAFHYRGESQSNHKPWWRIFLMKRITDVHFSFMSRIKTKPNALYNESGDGSFPVVLLQAEY